MKLHTTVEGDPLCILHFLFLPSTWNLFLLLWSIDYPKRKKRQRDRRRKAKGKERKHEIVREQYHRPSYLIQQTLFLPSFSFLFHHVSPIPFHCTHSTYIPFFTSLLSISVNRTSKASELDGEWQYLLLVCRKTCLLQSVSLKASAKCLSRHKAIVLVSSPLRSQTSPFFFLHLLFSHHFCTLMEHFTSVCVCVKCIYESSMRRVCVCVYCVCHCALRN